MRTTTLPATQLRNAHLHGPFLAILPRIEAHGNVYFRHLKCSHRKEEALAEMRALSWKWFIRLLQRGKDPSEFVSALAVMQRIWGELVQECAELAAVDREWQAADGRLGKARFVGEKGGEKSHGSWEKGDQGKRAG